MNNRSSKSSSSIFIGLLLVILGIGFLLQMFDIWNFGEVIGTWWPLLIIIFALTTLINASHNQTIPLIILIVGILFQLQQLDIVNFNIWSLWPLILIMIGISLILPKYKPSTKDVTTTSDLNDFTMFGGIDRKVENDNFKGGDINVLFGGVKIDLRKSNIAPNAVINIFAAFGGVEIIVPENCQVESFGTPILGGWEDKTTQPAILTQKLKITGSVIFGGVEIKN